MTLKLPGEQRRFFPSTEEAVSHAYAVTGESDVVLMLRLRDMDEFNSLCDRLFGEETAIRI